MKMKPRLIIISGSLRGTVFALPEDETSIGREASNRVCVGEPSVSRRHCVIKRDAGQFKIVDLDSYNSTFLNDVPIKEHPLQHGDRISIGDISLLFLHDESEGVPPSPIQLDEGNLITRSTVRLQREDAVYLHPERVTAVLPPTARIARDLGALLKISTTINSIRNLDALQRQLLELIFEVIPAERGAILLVEKGQEEFISIFSRSKSATAEHPIRVSRSVTNQVIREGVAILCNDVLESESFSSSQSLVASRISSLLCVPLIVFEEVLGVVYLDTSDPVVRFDEKHLQLMMAVAGTSAIALSNVRQLGWLESETRRLYTEINIEHKMVGESAQMRAVYQFIAKVAPADSTVLIYGESGTGKELVAHAIHSNGPRAMTPFVAINCATLTETLLESELFGHEKGAFTGAIAQKRGKLEIANGGTLFLDEIGELTPLVQAKLLRVLQEREFERVGSTRPIKVDVRVIAATNKNLEEAVRAGSFRQDLYFRLNVVSLMMPPLRERREDIPLLASYFAAKYSQKSKRRIAGISPAARACLKSYSWPGNVRELENAIERAVVMGMTDRILPEDLPEAVLETAAASPHQMKFYEAVKEMKKQIILQALEQASGNYTEAAKLLGIHPNNLHRLIRNIGLKLELNK